MLAGVVTGAAPWEDGEGLCFAGAAAGLTSGAVAGAAVRPNSVSAAGKIGGVEGTGGTASGFLAVVTAFTWAAGGRAGVEMGLVNSRGLVVARGLTAAVAGAVLVAADVRVGAGAVGDAAGRVVTALAGVGVEAAVTGTALTGDARGGEAGTPTIDSGFLRKRLHSF